MPETDDFGVPSACQRELRLDILQILASKPANRRPHSAAISQSSHGKISLNRLRLLLLALVATETVFGLHHLCFAQSASLPTEQAAPAESLIDTSGVCTHLTYTDSPYYTQWPAIFNNLQQLGVKHIRDGYTNLPPGSPIFAEHQQLAKAGITTDYIVPFDTSITVQTLHEFASEVGDLEALEAPNECDILGNCGGDGNVGIANVVSVLPTLQSAANAIHVPLIGPSYVFPASYLITGNVSSLINLNSMHLYFSGRNPGSAGWGAPDEQNNAFGSFAFWRDQSAIDAPGVAPAITETGYMSFPSTSTPFTLPESVEASYIPRTLLLGFKNGYQETFFYQLLDDPSSPPGFGLLRGDMSQKPAFTALSNLLKLLSDQGGTFTPGSLQYSIAGVDSNLNHLLLQKSDGSYWLVLWLEEPSWDPVIAAPIAVNPENIGINLGSGFATTTDYQFDSNGNVTSFNQPMNGNWTSLTVTDQISVVKIVPQ